MDHRVLYDISRAIDGECNSIMHPSWGAASTPFGRIVAPWYADGHGSPRGGWESAQVWESKQNYLKVNKQFKSKQK